MLDVHSNSSVCTPAPLHPLRLLSCLVTIGLLLLSTVPTAAAQDVPVDGLMLRLKSDALEAENAPPALTELDASLDRPTPYTAASIHSHDGRWSVTISQGTLREGNSPSRFVHDGSAEFFFYDRVLDKNERSALQEYLAAHYNSSNAEQSEGPAREGIHVKGSWSIEVRDVDDNLVTRRSFENDLSGTGKQIADLLTRNRATGPIQISTGNPTNANSPCETSDGNGANCRIVVPDGTDDTPNDRIFKTLTVEVPSSGNNEGKIVLNGSLVAQKTGSLHFVTTQIHTCEPDTSPDSCSRESGNRRSALTSKDLDSAVDVEEDQQVKISVVIGFQ